MKYIVEYDVCIDDDFPNPACFVNVEAGSKEEAIAKFRERKIIGAVVLDVHEVGESR